MTIDTFINRRRHFQLLGALALGVLPPLATGCGPSSDPFGEVRARVLLSTMPDDVQSLAESYAAFEEGKLVAVVGRIFSESGSPFDPQSAAFQLIELPKPGHNHDDPSDCPFCKREMENAATAVVQVTDAAGEVWQHSAEQLLGLTRNQDIVVEGSLTKVGEILVLNARSVYLLSTEQSLDLAERIHS